MRKFTKYPQGYVKASSNIQGAIKDLTEHLDYMSDNEIDALEVSIGYGEPEIWFHIPDYLETLAESVLDEIPKDEDEFLWYQIEYHPDDNSIVFGVSGDVNFETLRNVSESTKQRFINKFKQDLGII